MGYQSLTPFGRTAEAVRAALRTPARPAEMQAPVDKWQLLRDLTAGRARFDLSDRDMTVLQALLSCHPETRLDAASGPLIVHPSNETICARANGMPCSTMRRHLAKLIAAGLITRRDSPNGKRYARRLAGTKIAFGFDLRPLAQRAAEIAGAAEACRAEAAERAALRETVSLQRRDLVALLDLAAQEAPSDPAWSPLADLATSTARALRRKLDRETLARIEAVLSDAIATARHMLGFESDDPSTNDARNEQHQQRSKKESQDSESDQVAMLEETPSPVSDVSGPQEDAKKIEAPLPPFRLVQNACTEIAVFTPDPIHDWPSLIRATDKIRPMTGISDAMWHEAKSIMGAGQAAAALSAMLQRFSEIRNPGGYLRKLVACARDGKFSPTRMIMALSPAPA